MFGTIFAASEYTSDDVAKGSGGLTESGETSSIGVEGACFALSGRTVRRSR